METTEEKTSEIEVLKLFEEYFEIESKLKGLSDRKDEIKSELKKNISAGESEFSIDGYKVRVRESVTKTLKAELVEKILNVKVTEDCYRKTKSSKCYVLKCEE